MGTVTNIILPIIKTNANVCISEMGLLIYVYKELNMIEYLIRMDMGCLKSMFQNLSAV
jgi:hypothetical protein